jgi:hypothetical protein
MNLDGFSILCRLADRNKSDKSGSVAAAVVYLAPFMRNPAAWRKEQISPYKPSHNFFLALAGIGLGKPEYVELQKSVGVESGAWMDLVSLLIASST